jgi:hypothetical protein
MESAKSINRIASEFLQQYLQRNPTGYFPRVCCSEHKAATSYSDKAAESFLKQLQATETDRIELTEPESVIVVRVCPTRLPKYLAGTRKDGKLVWTYHNHLAFVFNREDGDMVSKRLEQQGIPNFVLPAAETKHSGYSLLEVLLIVAVLLTINLIALPTLLDAFQFVRSLMSLVNQVVVH